MKINPKRIGPETVAKIDAALVGRWDLTVRVPKFALNGAPAATLLPGVEIRTGSVHEQAYKGGTFTRLSLETWIGAEQPGELLGLEDDPEKDKASFRITGRLAIGLEDITIIENRISASGIGYVEKSAKKRQKTPDDLSDEYFGNSPAVQFWEAVRAKTYVT